MGNGAICACLIVPTPHIIVERQEQLMGLLQFGMSHVVFIALIALFALITFTIMVMYTVHTRLIAVSSSYRQHIVSHRNEGRASKGEQSP